MPIRPDVKVEWVRRLREPGRKQATECLRSDTGAQCCLDVLMEYASEQGVIEPAILGPGEYIYHYVDGDFGRREVSVLTEKVVNWAWEDSTPNSWNVLTDPEVMMHNSVVEGRVNLSAVNDDHGKTFLEIADLIEADDGF